MPGMMDTVLNLGLNDDVAAGLAARSGDRFAYDSYRRFLDMFGNVVSTLPHTPLTHYFCVRRSIASSCATVRSSLPWLTRARARPAAPAASAALCGRVGPTRWVGFGGLPGRGTGFLGLLARLCGIIPRAPGHSSRAMQYSEALDSLKI